ncbi:MAG: branched-chain amino acid ABC transporter permease [Limnochordaceae bacterium]|uniref:Branched-chain amino acid ABC transporter permease n=1 Tax=Carboxydichorda subterranea TaxID=3109565 RepID=A0ABZ1BV18_9FIRM|nr:branched-chain amino acid ABC transporter permease [Limnochorda sp. L945t]MBE3597453.1 branched-chain amino acid ABC transporter permease [Limnochordaceae bacterium]WRP16506.1 branched-chain amino acid ABC transporter permease [Limnochorda sp. L945t]
MNVDVLVQQLLNGISLGGLYSLLAVGYTMVYGILRLINFAHGDIFMVGAYVAFFLVGIYHLPWWIAAPGAALATALLGVTIDRAAYRPLRNEPRISVLITAVGVSFLIENLGLVIVGGRPKGMPVPDLMGRAYSLGSFRVAGVSLWVPALTLLLVGGLLVLVYRTRMGMAMRALSRDIEATRLMGVDVDRVISYTFAVGSILAAAGGIMWSFKFPQVNPLMGIYPGWKAFTAAVVGGIGNIVGAMIGGFIIGIVEIMTVGLMPQLSGYRDAFVFAILIFFLLVRPSGLLGEPLKEKV